jgi:crotonobetainyl-CoA:carnitine CoA-transferase CaiB-like acyl-CoA transferase
MPKPLDGVRVLEWAVWLAGPGAAMMLGDMGAEVIKIEQPKVGDPSRGLTQLEGMRGGQRARASVNAALYAGVNRNKKCITVDVTKPKGKEIVYRLVKKCDVFLQNFRAQVRKEAQLDYEHLSKYNPKLVYVNVSSLGPYGPEAWRRGNDYVGQARSGFMTNFTGLLGEPATMGSAIGDHMASIMTVQGTLAALLAKERLGIGQEIDTSIVGSMIELQRIRMVNTAVLGEEVVRVNRKKAANPLANHYKCKDGKWIGFCILASGIVWPDFCKAIGIQDLEKDPRFESTEKRSKNCEALIEILDNKFLTKTRDEWVEVVGKFHRIMFSPVLEGIEVLSDPQAIDNKYVVEYDFPSLGGKIKTVGCAINFHETPAGIQAPAPEFGQHTEEVLLELGGYTWEDIAKLKEEEVI